VRVPQHINFLAGIAASEAVGINPATANPEESSTTQKFAFDLANVLVQGAGVDKEVLKIF